MGPQVTMGATTMCSFGVAPSTLMVLPVRNVLAGAFAANVGDSAPIVNLLPFGVCTSLANPTVAAATAAALGVLTPMPCVPVPTGPWLPGNTKVLVANLPAVDINCKAMCAWGGVIQILNPGLFQVLDG